MTPERQHEAYRTMTLRSTCIQCPSWVFAIHNNILTCWSMQVNHVEYESRIPGYEALGYCAPSCSAFVVRADALQKCNWLPMHTRAPQLALGQELKLQEYLSYFINEPLAVGKCAVLCCDVMCCAVLCCAVLCCAVLCCAVLVLLGHALRCALPCFVLLVGCCAVLCCAVLCCAVLCCAVLCCAVLCCATACVLLALCCAMPN